MIVTDYKYDMAQVKHPEISFAIKQLMSETGTEPKHIYKLLGINDSTVSTWLNGRYSPRLDNLAKIEWAIEQHSGRRIPRGTILRIAKHVEVDLAFELATTDQIPDHLRWSLVAAFAEARQEKERMESESSGPLELPFKMAHAS